MASGKDDKAPDKDERICSGMAALRNLMIAVAVALGLRFFVMEPFQIPTGSMEPTLIGREGWGDRIFAGKFSYSKTFGSEPKRWDIVVFYLKELGSKKKRLVKRLIGLPNESVEICDGDIFIDGKIARKPPDLQEVLWHTLYDGNFSNSMEARHRPWIVEKGPTDAWLVEDGRLVINNNKPGAKPTTIRYDGSKRGVHLTNIYIRRSYRAFTCLHCDKDVYYQVDTAHTWVHCPMPKCGKDFNVVLENMLGLSKNSSSSPGKRYPNNAGDEVPVNDLAIEAVWIGDDGKGGDVTLAMETRGRRFRARFMPETSEVIIGGSGQVKAEESIKVASPGKRCRLRLAFWDSTLAVYWMGEPVWSRELHPRRRLVEIQREPSSMTVTVGRGKTSFDNIIIQRDLFYVADRKQHGAMDSWAYGIRRNLGKDEYFFMGDNSPSSRDSRWWGTIKRDAFVGRAWFVFWPLNRARWIK